MATVARSRVSLGGRCSFLSAGLRRCAVPGNMRMCRVGNPFFFKTNGGFRRIVTTFNSHPLIHIVHVHGIPFISSANVRGLAGLYRVDRGRSVRIILSNIYRGMGTRLRGTNFCGVLNGRGVASRVDGTLGQTRRVVRTGGW